MSQTAVQVRDVPADSYRPFRHVAGLDGLRAFAVVGAMLFHAGVLPGGFLGVDLFFVLSGFLITGLLLHEADRTGRIDLLGFWTRRIRRLLPAVLLLLAVILVWVYTWAPPATAHATANQTAWSLVYLNNWSALFGDAGYWAATAIRTPLTHLWSLAIEEQFYLVWPLLVAGAFRLRRSHRVIATAALTAASLSAGWQFLAAAEYGTERAYLGTDTRAVALALGCLLAVLLARRADLAARVSPRIWGVVALVTGGWLAWSWGTAEIAEAGLYRGRLVSCGVAATLLVAAVATCPDSRFVRVLSARPLVWLGKRSYSLYLWHWPIWVMVDGWIPRIGLTLLAAVISYNLVEQPVRHSSLAGRRLVWSMGLPSAAIAVLVLVFPPALPPSMAGQPVSLAGSGGSGSLKVLIAGDSWARNMGFGLSLADTGKRDTFINLGVGGCGLVNWMDPSSCQRVVSQWPEAVATHHPDAVLLMTSSYDTGANVTVDGRKLTPCAPGFAEFYGQKLDRAIAALSGPDRIPVYLTTGWDDRHSGATAPGCINKIQAEAADRNSAHLLDLGGLLCPEGRCTTSREGQSVLDETNHLAPAGQRWAGGWILEALHREVHARGGAPEVLGQNPCRETPDRAVPVTVQSYSSQPDKLYPDSGNELTDGVVGPPTFSDPSWQGWQQGKPTIVLDLGTSQQVCEVKSMWMQELKTAIVLPTSVSARVSDDPAGKGELLGISTGPQISAGSQVAPIRIAGNTPLTGRYVTIDVDTVGPWSFLGEVVVSTPA
ncbi:acyltransferase [Pseudonocardiaceae bacterium YIM PH 21723]|nr:acyltransferase [Pseudonocardiaceae bacterium YIM PH 21723]